MKRRSLITPGASFTSRTAASRTACIAPLAAAASGNDFRLDTPHLQQKHSRETPPEGGLLAGPCFPLAEQTKEEVHEAAELANLAGAILRQGLPDGDDAAGAQCPRDPFHELPIGRVVKMVNHRRQEHDVVHLHSQIV